MRHHEVVGGGSRCEGELAPGRPFHCTKAGRPVEVLIVACRACGQTLGLVDGRVAFTDGPVPPAAPSPTR